MADVDDMWYEDDLDEPGKKRRSSRYGKGKRWQARWRDPAGNQRKKNFAKKGDADKHVAKMETDKAAGAYADPNAGKITFERYAETWRKARAHDPATAARIEIEFRLHVYEDPEHRGRTRGGGVAIGQHQMGMLARSPSVMQQWIAGLPLAARSKLLVITDVSQVFSAAIDDGRIGKNPLSARSIQKPKADKVKAVALTEEQSAAIADALEDRVRAMAMLAEACGHRQGEAFAVAVPDIDFLRKTVDINVQIKHVDKQQWFAPVKNRHGRVAPLADPMPVVLAEHIRRYPPVEVTLPWHDPLDPAKHGKPVTRKLLFTRISGEPWGRSAFNLKWYRALEKVGLPSRQRIYGFHVERHTLASRLLGNGVSLAKVADVLGDTQKVVLENYSHFMPSDDDRVRDVLALFFTGRESAREEQCAQNVPSEGVTGLKTAGGDLV